MTYIDDARELKKKRAFNRKWEIAGKDDWDEAYELYARVFGYSDGCVRGHVNRQQRDIDWMISEVINS